MREVLKKRCAFCSNAVDKTQLHAANYFVRELTVVERAAATKALGAHVQSMREADPSLSGVRTEDIKAAIIEEQTGRKMSGKTISRWISLKGL